jgi:hypothetical protein
MSRPVVDRHDKHKEHVVVVDLVDDAVVPGADPPLTLANNHIGSTGSWLLGQ